MTHFDTYITTPDFDEHPVWLSKNKLLRSMLDGLVAQICHTPDQAARRSKQRRLPEGGYAYILSAYRKVHFPVRYDHKLSIIWLRYAPDGSGKPLLIAMHHERILLNR